jgi:flagellar protein FliO/FliZ
MGAAAGPHEVALIRSCAQALPPPRATPLLDMGSRPRQPELATITHPAPQIALLPEAPAALPLPPQAETSTRPQPDTLAALADNLSTPSFPPRKSPTTVTRPHPTEPRFELRPELRPERRLEPQRERQIVTPQPTAAQPATAETASTPDEELAELARQLEAALRKPHAAADARPSAIPARAAPAPEQASAAEAVPTPPTSVRTPRPPTYARPAAPALATPSLEQALPADATPTPTSAVHAPRSSEQKPPRADANPNQANTPYDSLEQELTSLLRRSAKH